VADAYTAAQNAGSTFKLFLSFDMTALPCNTSSDASTLVNYINTYASNPAQFKYPTSSPKVFASTFSGESCTFGQSTPGDGWQSQFKNQLTGASATYFVPSFFADPSTFGSSGLAQSMDGAFNWNGAWPVNTTTDILNSLLSNVDATVPSLPNDPPESQPQVTVQDLLNSTTSDQQYVSALSKLKKSYMGGVSPWFFTHYSPQTFNKNWIYLSDYLFPQRWQSIIQNRDMFDIMEIITWNDYGESHYVGPIEGTQPDSQGWVNGFNHTGWLDLVSYFATAYKNGTYPEITTDRIILWARPHPANATAANDTVAQPDNFAMAQDSMFAVVLATQPANVTLATPQPGQQPSLAQATTFAVPSGMSQLNFRLVPGSGMRAILTRAGATVVDVNPASYVFNATPPTYNFNAFVVNAHS